MPKEYLGEIPKKDQTVFPYNSKAGPFQADDRIADDSAGRMANPEHDAAIAAAMKPLYGGMVGSRCDPVEEWPGDHDELYGMPKSVREGMDTRVYGEADRDDAEPLIADKPGTAGRKIAVSDLSGTDDGLNRPDADELTAHH